MKKFILILTMVFSCISATFAEKQTKMDQVVVGMEDSYAIVIIDRFDDNNDEEFLVTVLPI